MQRGCAISRGGDRPRRGRGRRWIGSWSGSAACRRAVAARREPWKHKEPVTRTRKEQVVRSTEVGRSLDVRRSCDATCPVCACAVPYFTLIHLSDRITDGTWHMAEPYTTLDTLASRPYAVMRKVESRVRLRILYSALFYYIMFQWHRRVKRYKAKSVTICV